jgi:hypothetical protein
MIMNTPKVGLRVAAFIFALVCLAHGWRLLRHIDVRVGSHDLPMWLSIAGVFIAGGLSLWLWRLSTSR